MVENKKPDFTTEFVNLASTRLGASVEFATDDFFADKSRIIQDYDPVFYPDRYDDNGKWMDGWESRRRRGEGHDYCVIKLGCQTRIVGVCIDTSHFTGNYPPGASLEVAVGSSAPDDETQWTEILPQSDIRGDTENFFEISSDLPATWLRLNIYPDGGVARLRVYGEPLVDWPELIKSRKQLELSGIMQGGRIIGYSNAHYGQLWSLLAPDKAKNMGDGWETRRRREPGNDWIVIALGHLAQLDTVELDTAFFKGNFPESFSIHGAYIPGGGAHQAVVTQSMSWPEIFPRSKLTADAVHTFEMPTELKSQPISHVRLNVYPDGGVSRLRIIGRAIEI